MSDLGNKTVFSKNLKKYMSAADINRRQLSDDLNISYTTLCEWVSGKKYPRIDKIELLAKYFGVTKSHLIEENYRGVEPTLAPLIDELVTVAKKLPSDKVETLIHVAEGML